MQKIIEQKDATQEATAVKIVNAGVYKIHKNILESYLPLLQNDKNNQREFYLTDVIFYANLSHHLKLAQMCLLVQVAQ